MIKRNFSLYEPTYAIGVLFKTKGGQKEEKDKKVHRLKKSE